MRFFFALSVWLVLHRSCALRTQHLGRIEAQAGCSSQSTCESCLSSSPRLAAIRGVSFCKWCPQEFWNGEGTAFEKNATGVCRTANRQQDICGGGSGWQFVGRSPFKGNSQRGWRAETFDEAQPWCPAPSDKSVWDIKTLSSLKAKHFEEPAVLETTLHLLNLDLKRLQRLQATNPHLYKALFDPRVAMKAGTYAWKTAVWGVTFVPVVGGITSLGLGLATSAVEYGAGVRSDVLMGQRTSQSGLVSGSEKAILEYFSDVTFGTLEKQYQNVKTALQVSQEELERKTEKKLGGALVGDTGIAVSETDKALSHPGWRAGKAVLHTGLFIGGFFTFGVTWFIGAGIGAAEMMTEWSVAYAAAKSIEQKTFLLLSMANKLDESAWAAENSTCLITDWDSSDDLGLGAWDPCPAIERSNGRKAPRVCSRTSAWRDTMGELSAEGRCIPRIRHGLEDGSPCVAHEACTTGYCHFEPKLLNLFSDHQRSYCLEENSTCTSASTQFQQLHLSAYGIDNSAQLEFTSHYKGSFQGPLYATMGTCSTPCEKSELGRGDCIGRPLDKKSMETLNEVTDAVGFEFGVRQRGFISAAKGIKKFTHVGNGYCCTRADNNIHMPVRNLQSEHVLDLSGDDQDLSAQLTVCANACWSYEEDGKKCESFTMDEGMGTCVLHTRKADTVNVADEVADLADQPGKTVCYSGLEDFPLDIYQPWNFQWHTYRLNLRMLVDNMLNQEAEDTRALDAVRQAYKDYCPKSKRGVQSDCEDPADWTPEKAHQVLVKDAPLSASQLAAATEAAFPGTTESHGKPGETIRLRDLMFRPHGFGEAWRLYLGKLNVQEVVEEMKKEEAGEAVHYSTLDKNWVQKVETHAVQQGLRTATGIWDFREAQDQLLVAEMPPITIASQEDVTEDEDEDDEDDADDEDDRIKDEDEDDEDDADTMTMTLEEFLKDQDDEDDHHEDIAERRERYSMTDEDGKDMETGLQE